MTAWIVTTAILWSQAKATGTQAPPAQAVLPSNSPAQTTSAQGPSSNPVPSPVETNQGHMPGSRIERTMRLLTTSSAKSPNRVRILFYGQSITATGQGWWRIVYNDLKKRYPSAKIEAQNIAISGFSAGYLQWNAINDIRIFNPDLIIFHDYGSNEDYETICQNMLKRTHAELLIQSDHYTRYITGKLEDIEEDKSIVEHDQHSVWMRQLADKYNFALLDIRHLWWNHLKANKVDPKSLLRDHAHMNDAGDALMAQLTLDYMVPPKPGDRGPGDDRVTTIVIEPKDWKNGAFEVPSEFNQVSLECDGGTDQSFSVKVNGQRPSSTASLYYTGRTSLAWKTWFPILTHIPLGPNPVSEQWTLTLYECKSSKQFLYRLVGSRTGYDGDGDSTQDFTSKSGRIIIPVKSWIQWYGNNTPPENFEIKFATIGSGVDRVEKGTEFQILGNGFPVGTNTLRLFADKTPKKPVILRFYRPSIKDEPPKPQ